MRERDWLAPQSRDFVASVERYLSKLSPSEIQGKIETLADSFVILPGGAGTLEEFFEIWVGRFLKFHDKPIVILDPFDLYQPLLNLIEHLERENFVKPGQRELLFWAKDVEQALDFISKQ